MRNPNGYGGVTKLPGNRRRPYRVRITLDWEPRQNAAPLQKYATIGYYETQADALVALAKFHNAPYDVDMRAITFKEVYDQWSPEHFKRYPSVRRVSECAMEHCKTIWERKMRDLRPAELQRVIGDMEGLSSAYQYKVRSLMHMLFQWCLKNDILHKDYSRYVEISPQENVSNRKIFTGGEISMLRRLYEKNDPLPGEPEKYRGSGLLGSLIVLLYSGMRVGELLGLRRDDIHLDERYIDLKGTKTRAARRLVPIHRDILPVLQRLLDGSEGERLIDLTYSQYKYSWFDRVMTGLCLDHTPHDTRHTFISGLDTAGVPRSVQKFIVGHSLSRDVTDRYTHKDLSELIREVDRLEY